MILKRLLSNKPLELTPNQLYYIVPFEFTQSVKKYVKAKAKNEQDLPINRTAMLVCDLHGGLVCNLPAQIQSNQKKRLANCSLVNHHEWEFLQSNYPLEGPSITFSVDEKMNQSLQPDRCDTCMKEILLSYESAIIWISKVDRKEQDTTSLDAQVSSQGRQLKKRKLGNNALKKKRETLQLQIKPTTTVRSLKLELMDRFQAPPLYQKILYQNRELEDDATMRGIGIMEGDELQLEIFDQEGKEFEGKLCRMIDLFR
jgi:hypothetical protein